MEMTQYDLSEGPRSKFDATVAQTWRMSRRFSSGAPRTPRPLDAAALQALALAYVGRYATTRAKLTHYLERKIATRGWDEEGEPPIAAIVARFVERGYIDDAAFAIARGAALGRRGYGARRVVEALRAAGVESHDTAPAEQIAREEAVEAALRYAKRRHIGPFAREQDRSPEARRRAFGSLLRAGHESAIARQIAYSDESFDP